MNSKEGEPQTFEDAINELEAIVSEMESGELGLEDSVNRYERGCRLAKFCRDRLRVAEETVRRLNEEIHAGSQEDGQGRPPAAPSRSDPEDFPF